MKFSFSKLFFFVIVFLAACGNNHHSNRIGDTGPVEGFDDYWFRGKAEISSFQLNQPRYGQMHTGEAILIFVTEDFSMEKQVKSDNPASSPNTAPVLKLNSTRKFFTGIYPYSMMTSVFTPIFPENSTKTIKVTTSSQEWCGHTFTQLNLKGSKYNFLLRSYFESEGDREWESEVEWLEDEIWTLLRINPEWLPVGEVEMLPSTINNRLRHGELKPLQARASLEKMNEITRYTIHYPQIPRTLIINFQNAFPHIIEGWEEKHLSGFGEKARLLTTIAKRKKTIRTDYWNKNNPEDKGWRDSLALINIP